jgi:hypothetical protein
MTFQNIFRCLFCRLIPTGSYVAGTHISFMWFLELSSNLLIFLVFGFRVHLFPDAANSELREYMAVIVGLFVRVVLSIAVMIACCSALYIEDWDFILFLINNIICDDSKSNLFVLQRSIRVNLIIFVVFVRHKECELSLVSFPTRSFGNGPHGDVNGLVLVN